MGSARAHVEPPRHQRTSTNSSALMGVNKGTLAASTTLRCHHRGDVSSGAKWTKWARGMKKNFRAPLAPPYVWRVVVDPWQLSGPGGQGGGGGRVPEPRRRPPPPRGCHAHPAWGSSLVPSNRASCAIRAEPHELTRTSETAACAQGGAFSHSANY